MDDNMDDEPEVEDEVNPEEGAVGAEEEEPLVASPATAPELDPEIEQEIKRVMVEEEPVKAKGQMLPDRLIYKELEPEDLFDPGSI